MVWAAPPTGLPGAMPQQRAVVSEEKNVVTDLDSENPATRQTAMSAILKSRDDNEKQVAALIERYVDAPDRQGTVKDCMLLLGRLHATTYVALLVKHLTFEAFFKNTKRPQPLEDLHPAIPALIDIGSPAIKPVLERLSAEDGETLQRAGAAVLRGVLGTPWAILIVEDARKRAADPAKGRLAQVLQLLQVP